MSENRPIKLTQKVGQYELSGEFRTVDEALEFLRRYEELTQPRFILKGPELSQGDVDSLKEAKMRRPGRGDV